MKKGFLQGKGSSKKDKGSGNQQKKGEKGEKKDLASSSINSNPANKPSDTLPKSVDLGIDKLNAPKPAAQKPQRPTDSQPPPPSPELNAALATLFAPKTLERYQRDPMFQDLVGKFEGEEAKTTLTAEGKMPVPKAPNTTSTSTTETTSGLKEHVPTLSAEGKKPVPNEQKKTSFKQLIEFFDEDTFVSTKAQATFLAQYFPLFESYEKTFHGMQQIKEKAKKVHEVYDKRLSQYEKSLEEARFLNKELNSRLSLACDEVGRGREWFKKLEADLAEYKLIIADREEVHRKENEENRAKCEVLTRKVKFLEKEVKTSNVSNVRIRELEESEGKLKKSLSLQTQKFEKASMSMHDLDARTKADYLELQRQSTSMLCDYLQDIRELESSEGKLKEALLIQTQELGQTSLNLHNLETQAQEHLRKQQQMSSYNEELKKFVLSLRAENAKSATVVNKLNAYNLNLREGLLSKEKVIEDLSEKTSELESIIQVLTEASINQRQELEKSSLQMHNLQTQLDYNQGQRSIEKAAWRIDLTELQTQIGKSKKKIVDLESDAKALEDHCKNIEVEKLGLQEEVRKLKEKLKMMKAGAEIYEKKRKDDFDDYFTGSVAIIKELAEGYKEDRRKETELVKANFDLTLHETMLLRKEAHGYLEKAKTIDHALAEVVDVKQRAENLLEQTNKTFSMNAFTTETYYNTKPRKIVQDMFTSEIFPVIDEVKRRNNAQAESFRILKEDIYKAHLRITELKEGVKEKKKNSLKEEREAIAFSKTMKDYVEKPEKILDLKLEGCLGETKDNTLTKFNFRYEELPVGFIFPSSFGNLTVSEHFNPSRKLGYSSQRTQGENEIQNLYNMMGNQGRVKVF